MSLKEGRFYGSLSQQSTISLSKNFGVPSGISGRYSLFATSYATCSPLISYYEINFTSVGWLS